MTKNKHADTWLGTHQKINRLAYKSMRSYLTMHEAALKSRTNLSRFPTLKLIQHFEGDNGPDGLKLKSPGQNEPPHFYDPYTRRSSQPIHKMITIHRTELARAIRENNQERAAFEASWLAHALVDGMTPSHHYPYEEELEALRGETGTTRTSKAKKLTIKGSSKKETITKTWKLIGAKGLLTTHVNFEAGIASSIIPLRLGKSVPSTIEMAFVAQNGLIDAFNLSARSIADLRLYERFYSTGWTTSLSRDVRGQLLPTIVKTVTLSWLDALVSSDA